MLAASVLLFLALAPATTSRSMPPLLRPPFPLHWQPAGLAPVKNPLPSRPVTVVDPPERPLVEGAALARILPAMLPGPPPAPPPPPRPSSNVVGDVPFLWQIYALSCESAALQMVLAHEGIQASQDQILQLIGSDLRWAYWDASGMRWGDPYATFVGDVDGSEDYLTGYGTYYPPIARAAEALHGRVLRAGQGISPEDVYNAILDGHPVVLWISYDYAFHPRQDYVTFEGRTVLYAGPFEHAVTGAGVRGDAILIHDPMFGEMWVDKVVFEETFRTYERMAVVID